jgi:hypothetical protein
MVGERRTQVLERKLRCVRVPPAVVGQQVPGRVARRRRVVVVRAEHEHARLIEQRAEPGQRRRHRVDVREVVAGVDDKIGLEPRERAQPGPLPVLARRQVQVADVEDPDRTGSRGQARDLHLAEREAADLDAGGVREAGHAQRDAGSGHLQERGRPRVCHAARLSHWPP